MVDVTTPVATDIASIKIAPVHAETPINKQPATPTGDTQNGRRISKHAEEAGVAVSVGVRLNITIDEQIRSARIGKSVWNSPLPAKANAAQVSIVMTGLIGVVW